MRLWHWKLLHYLPNKQLISQWRELNSIYKKQPRHILINYVYEYGKSDLYKYSCMVVDELNRRGINHNFKNWNSYFGGCWPQQLNEPFKNHHTDRYLLQCFYNLQEKFDRGQSDFSQEIYDRLYKFLF